MRGQRINRVSGGALIVLSLVASLTVLSATRVSLNPFSIHAQGPPQSDEGAQAHIFQLAIVLLAPAILLYLLTADWKRPLRSAQPLAFTAVVVTLAFAALYYLEHHP